MIQNYDYHLIVKELANEFEGQFECLGENKEKQKIFFIPIQKEITKINKNGNETVETRSYKIGCTDSARFISTSSLSNLVDNLTERIHKIKCKDCDCFLEHESALDIFIKYKCLSCNKDYSNKLDEELKKKFKNTLSSITMVSINLFPFC